jgi:MFS family permease
VYALLFADAGLSTGAISSLFAIWSIVAFLAEVPSGALADSWSRRHLYALGAALTGAGYALWIIWPAYLGFALGFVLWGIGGAFASGTLEALVYDDLAAADDPSPAVDPSATDESPSPAGEAYARVMGRAGTAGILAMLAATLLATPAYAVGGYRLVGIASVAVVTLGGLLALRLPAPADRTGEPVTESNENPYWATLRDGLRESVRNRRVAWAVAIAALVPGFTALDEYLPLLSRDKGAPTELVPLLFGLTALAMAAGSALAGRFPALPRRHLAALLAAAAALLAGGALVRSIVGMVAVSAAFGVLQFAIVLTETRLQEVITGRARTTVLSVSGFLSEVFAVALYALFALNAPLAALFALSAVPLAATALAIARYL